LIRPAHLRPLRVGLGIAAAVVTVAALVTLWGAARNLTLRPLDGVEGELLFEASRIRSGLALYVDPAVGAADYGAVPARYYVLYPPLWAAVLSLSPAAWAETAGRAAGFFAWWGVLAWLAASARGSCRVPAALAAAFVGGVFSLAEFGGSLRPDSVALAVAGLALARSVRRADVGFLGGALFALAAWTKPNVLGVGAGALVASLVFAPRVSLRALAGAAAVSLLVAGALQRVSSGAWVAHLLAATGQPLLIRLLAHHLVARGQFFLFFLGLAAWHAARSPSGEVSGEKVPPRALALGALAGSFAWSLLAFAKIGGAANYWMEPCLAAVVLFARFPPPALAPRGASLLAVAIPLQTLWTGVGSVRATFESIDAHRSQGRLLASARDVCGAPPGALVVGDEPGIEVELEGRLVAHAFPLTHQILRGRLDPGPWLHDLERPEVACVVTAHDRIERPPSDVDVAYDYFAPSVRAALASRFAPAASAAGWEVYAPRAEGDR
jgi:hypothetical protein